MINMILVVVRNKIKKSTKVYGYVITQSAIKINRNSSLQSRRGRRGHMVVGFIITYAISAYHH